MVFESMELAPKPRSIPRLTKPPRRWGDKYATFRVYAVEALPQ